MNVEVGSLVPRAEYDNLDQPDRIADIAVVERMVANRARKEIWAKLRQTVARIRTSRGAN